MVNWGSKKVGDVLLFLNGLVLLVLINVLSSQYYFRADLTEEKRYEIKDATKEILTRIDDQVFIEVYLEGELNAGFRRFRNSIRETLEEFRIYSDGKIQYTFTDPATAVSQKAQAEFMQEVASKGIQPTKVIDTKDGQRIEKLIFPGAVVTYGSAESGVQLLKGNKAATQEEEINQSIEGVEFELANAIFKLSNDTPKKIGFVSGHDELNGLEAVAFRQAVNEVYDVSDVMLTKDLSTFDVLVIVKPKKEFSPLEKFNLDQYLLQRGNVMMLLDKLDASMDSASNPNYVAFPYPVNLDDQLFRYGLRINPDLIEDRTSGKYPIVTGQSGTRPQIQLIDWPFFPMVNQYSSHPITNNLDGVVLQFVSSIDTVKAAGITKTPLMFTSQYSRAVTAPVNVNIQSVLKNDDPQTFTTPHIPIGYLLEGKFTSLFKNRFLPQGADSIHFKPEGKESKLIVISDGDLAKNVVHPRTRQPQPLGLDVFTNTTFANKDLLMNMLAYLTDENGLITARTKEIKIRPLNREKIASEKMKYQLINIALPILLIMVFAVVRSTLRKRRYANF
jgi:ABC-2 type transport system permease protein